MTEERVDVRSLSEEDLKEMGRTSRLVFQINQTMPDTPEYHALVKELFGDQIGEGSFVQQPARVNMANRVKIGKNVAIMYNVLMMSRGGITIEDNAMIAANAQLISNNHDPYDRAVLLCKPILIKENAWVGAGATILPGVTVGKNAIVAAGAVVTKDVPDNTVVGGNPAKFIKELDADRF